jgi:F-type H+-transporting ATPase subunit delta
MANPIARRYAQAYFDVANEKQEVAQWRRQLASAVEMVSSSEVQRVLSNPKLNRRERQQSVAELLDGAAQPTVNLMRLLVGRDRVRLAQDVLDEYDRLADDAAGITRAEVTTAVPVTPDLESGITASLQKAFGSSLKVKIEQDDRIVGGLIIRIGDRVIDNSVRTHLAQLRTAVAR